ncbi:sigma-70 family RNA polymerase sigma factor [Chitinophaga sedimenti]|uniref:RNA polymerase sigma factor n=1 Tax=Chitinophaga sedimenti TaxID=2033606 RepID=UPI002005536B|nr:sigma-70 family RNA polymerase sigma factor [Chitinophaga sedimenti]MCK7559459.1 sigma-70 family RNA polymerase sigma factor [Chitinophaga sedimenti]
MNRQENMVNDDTLRLFKQGDQEAFTSIVSAYFRRIMLSTLTLAVHEDAEEIVMTAFYRLWLNRETIEGEPHLVHYLLHITRNLCIDNLRKIKSDQRRLNDIKESGVLSNDDVHIAAVHAEVLELVFKYVTTLSPQMQTVFWEGIMGGKSNQEVADIIGKSASTVGHIKTSLKKLLAEKYRSFPQSQLAILLILLR